MAEEVQYDSGTIKRKYEDDSTTTPPHSGGRRTTGFSSGPIPSQSRDSSVPSYNSVPPPLDEFQLAKQRAQELAARFLNNADHKRPRVENGGGGYDTSDAKGFTSGFSSGPTDFGQKPSMSVAASVPSSYGYSGSKKIEIPNGRVGVIIGKSGETIKLLQAESGAKIQVTRDVDADPNALTRAVELMGAPEEIAKAEQLINDVLNKAEIVGSGIVSQRTQQGGAEQFVMKVPNNKVGLIIGKGGDTIKTMQKNSGARIQVVPLHPPPGDTSTERTIQIDGSSEQIEAAKALVNEVITENRLRNPAASGYSQQGYQARPPTNWAPPGQQVQQPGYGYTQPGAYPGQTPQYSMTQSQYAGYPPQPNSGGYATGWEQTVAANNQQATQGGGYDYYSQQSASQQQPSVGASGPADNAAYSYNQQPPSGYNQQGQGYTQDGYGGYHGSAPQPGYAQPQPVYDQQQGYSTTPGYSNASNPTPEGQTPSYGGQGDGSQAPQQGYSSQGLNTSYPLQVPTQPGYGTQPPSGYAPSYGAPQSQKPAAAAGQPPAYVQQQQSPTAQGGYIQPGPVQPGYPYSQPPPTQAGYAQPESGAQKVPSSGYGVTQASGYAPPPYGGAPPMTQSSYGVQPPPLYGNASGYSQTAAYSADGNGVSAAQVPPSGVSKASPQS